MAIASSFCNRMLDPETVVVGEVGLGGEVRSVPRIEARIKEAIHMGFKRCVLPKRNMKGLSQELAQKINLQGVSLVEEAVGILIGR
jgi:DNA repair protein RadA/Sms